MPRIGIAYQANEKTVIRAGYGIFYGSIGSYRTSANLAGFSQTTPIEATSDNGLTFKTTLSNPLPSGLLSPQGASGGLETYLGQNVTYFPTSRNLPYAQRWSIGIQRQLPGSFMVESSYVGNRGTRLPIGRNINALPAQYLSTSPTR